MYTSLGSRLQESKYINKNLFYGLKSKENHQEKEAHVLILKQQFNDTATLWREKVIWSAFIEISKAELWVREDPETYEKHKCV